MRTRILIVCGPTASGKSARAIDIAELEGGVIINADAMQVYRELRVLTARPSVKDEQQVPHALYGVLDAADSCSAAKWLALARIAIDKALTAGKLPIVTGGTGLYIKALMQGLSTIPDIAPQIRAQATALWQERADKALAEYDPLMGAQLKPGDSQRHTRALEVMLATGKSLAHWKQLPRQKAYPDADFTIEYCDVAREELYRRCNARFLAMLEAGAVEEVRALHALGLSSTLPAMRAVGVGELIAHLNGKWTLDEATKHAQQATRNYAKRQVTWFTHQLATS